MPCGCSIIAPVFVKKKIPKKKKKGLNKKKKTLKSK